MAKFFFFPALNAIDKGSVSTDLKRNFNKPLGNNRRCVFSKNLGDQCINRNKKRRSGCFGFREGICVTLIKV
ncbi:hypothetical protein BpHYR1_031308 [Brachionus plicatilis]|uniref:Uncharacterized protein n=1 Tax=Brachionus plicatilis TaxID=10195 RepID=A0A3M7T710_BRAPC|nr:hypothetical protein BpHYR1_031308 [Brachionus plicatilis]